MSKKWIQLRSEDGHIYIYDTVFRKWLVPCNTKELPLDVVEQVKSILGDTEALKEALSDISVKV
jgi:hypothetical protein